MTTTRFAMKIASSMSCVTNSTVLRSLSQIDSSNSCISERVWWSSAPNGSSSSRIRGSLASARAIAVRCCMPPESILRIVMLEAAQAHACRCNARRSRAAARARHCVLAQAEADVLAHGEPRKQRVALEHHAAIGARTRDRVRRRAARAPLVGASSPATMRSSVVLPQPEGPRIVMKSLSADRRATWAAAQLVGGPLRTPGNVRADAAQIEAAHAVPLVDALTRERRVMRRSTETARDSPT